MPEIQSGGAPVKLRGGIIRIHKKKCNYAQIDNRVVEDELISWRARGILCYLLSRPDNWQTRMSDLVNRSKRDGKSSVRAAIKELLSIGYMHRAKTRDEAGRLIGWAYEVYEKPRPPKSEKPTSVKRTYNKTEVKRKPKPEFVSTVDLLCKPQGGTRLPGALDCDKLEVAMQNGPMPSLGSLKS